jgi:tetratricopeptide (TPR) repeat protein
VTRVISRLLPCLALGLVPCTLWAALVTDPETPVPVVAARATPAAEKTRLGHEALGRGEYAKAEGLFLEAAALEPASPLPLLGLAESARIKGDEAGVKQRLNEALKVAPHDPQTLSAWGRWHFANRQYAKAEEYWKAALAADPRDTRTLVDLGDLAFEVRQRPADAVEFYRRALAVDPRLAGAHHALGMSLWRLGKPAEAVPEFEEAARLSPKNPLPLHALGRIHAEAGRADQAMAAFDRALAAQDTYYPARLDKADLLADAGKVDLALAEVQTVLRSQPKLAGAHVKAGMLLQRLGRDTDAMAAYQSALKIDPKLGVALNNLAWIASERTDVPDRGLHWAQAAVALDGNAPRYQGTLGWVLYKLGETAKALAVLEPLAKGRGKSLPETHYMLGVVYADSGSNKKAAAALREALRLDPAFGSAGDATARLRRLEGG